MAQLNWDICGPITKIPEAIGTTAIWAAVALIFMGSFHRQISSMLDRSDVFESELGPWKVRIGKSMAPIKQAFQEKIGADLSKQASKDLRNSAESAVKHRDLVRSLVLWVDDRPEGNNLEREAFKALGIRFVNVLSTEEALRTLRTTSFDLIISDMSRPDEPDGEKAGLKLYESVKAEGYGRRFVIYAGQHNAASATAAGLKATAKPDELYDFVLNALT